MKETFIIPTINMSVIAAPMPPMIDARKIFWGLERTNIAIANGVVNPKENNKPPMNIAIYVDSSKLDIQFANAGI